MTRRQGQQAEKVQRANRRPEAIAETLRSLSNDSGVLGSGDDSVGLGSEGSGSQANKEA